MDNYRNHLVLRKEFIKVKVVLSHQFYLTCSLMMFLIIVINTESLLVINVVMEIFLQMTFYYVLQQDLNLRNCWCLPVSGIIQRKNNKVRKALYSIKGFLTNSHIPIPYKRMLFSAIVIGQVLYYSALLGSNKERTRSIQTLVNLGLYWIEEVSNGNGNSFASLYCVSKELNIPPLSVKCAIAQVRCF
jgi:hypothetical protein